MRIIKVGAVVPEEKEHTCSKCKTEFAYTRSDVKEDRDGAYVECPTCNAFIHSKF